jgi:Kef-type K+ transport system membrane component KefB/mannitol/fructose-specific phosphotransferase system IIA component (Ntr-type)
MNTLTHSEITAMFLALGVLLASARILGEAARRFNQPAVLGEILAGILLGPTVFGALAPVWSAFVFPRSGGGAAVLDGMTTLAIALFLLVAGMEINLSTVWRQGRATVMVGLCGMALPFAFGFVAAWYLPEYLGAQTGFDPLTFALFMATVLSITALPIIAKILMDLNIYRSDMGVTIIAAAVLNDLIGWIIFAIVLSMAGGELATSLSLGHTIVLTLLFTAGMLTIVPWLIHRVLPWLQAYTSWPGGVLGFVLSMTLFCAAFTEWIGIHAIFGAFLAGVAIGQSQHLREQTRAIIEQFVSFIFAPLFFAGIGLHVSFTQNFDPVLTLSLLLLAVSGKVVGSALGARAGGLGWREAWGIGCGMSAQGTMGIILGLLALRYGVINEHLFVALVVMALVTSLMSGPLMQRVLRLKKPRRFTDHLLARGFCRHLKGRTRAEVIDELVQGMEKAAGMSAVRIAAAVLEREELMPTGIGKGMAVPHARLEGLEKPLVAVGISEAGLDFDAPDGGLAHIIFMILTPQHDNGAQLEILADIARSFKDDEVRDHARTVANFTEFLALVKSG